MSRSGKTRRTGTSPEDLFWYWINARHMIWTRRSNGEEKPWTDDPILRQYRFTNVFRQLDRVTIELSRRYRSSNNMAQTLWTVILFRMFNLPKTYDLLTAGGNRYSWNERNSKYILNEAKKRKEQIFTGAYIITNGGSPRPKTDIVCEAITKLWKDHKTLTKLIYKSRSLEKSTRMLQAYPMIGPFVAYEMVCDLRYTKLLDKATDTMTWSNVGPGAARGLNRIYRGGPRNAPENRVVVHLNEMRDLLLQERTAEHVPPLELREIEHSLCEFDKYMRVKTGEGRPRSKYDGS